MQVLSSLGGTAEMALHLGRRGTGPVEITAFIDSDFAEDTETRKSVSGFVLFCNNSPVAWFSKRQRLVAQSTTEAGYLAVYYGQNELVYF